MGPGSFFEDVCEVIQRLADALLEARYCRLREQKKPEPHFLALFLLRERADALADDREEGAREGRGVARGRKQRAHDEHRELATLLGLVCECSARERAGRGA